MIIKGTNIPTGGYGFLRRTNNAWHVVVDDNIVKEIENKGEYTKLGRDEYRLLGLEEGDARVIRFSDLHRHSDNSLKDGLTKVKDMVKRTEYSGALTDHGNMYGFLEYYKSMLAAGKKPILGFEGYMETNPGDMDRRHVILLAKNNKGYKNLLKLTSESFDHFKMRPHVTWDMLEKYHEGIICTSACLSGAIPTAIRKDNLALAEDITERFVKIFGTEDFYIEIQRHHIKAEDVVNPALLRIAKKFGLKVIATTDSHYPTAGDKEAHEVILCLQNNKTMNDEDRRTYDGDGYFLHNSEEMEQLFSDMPEVLDNTLEIAEKCNVEIKLGDVNLPNYEFPAPFTSAEDYMLHLAKEGFQKRFGGTEHEKDPVYLERFDYEYEMIKKMGFCAYFIIVWDFLNWSRTHNIYVGPGRGSAAGSLVAYCMGITDLDPIHYNLIFERFLNPERISYPDIDSDIEHVGRPAVIQYMIEKYGAGNVCRIVTFGTFAAKQALKDVARVFGFPAAFGAKLASLVPDKTKTIADGLKKNPEFKELYDANKDVHRVVDVAQRIEGGKRHASQHACGLCVAPSAVSDYLPTSMEIDEETGEKALTAQVVMSEVEELSLIKMDLLGLKNMSVIHEVHDAVIKHYGEDVILKQIGSNKDHFDYQDIPLDDIETYQMLEKGLTGGVFQLESDGMTKGVVVPMLWDTKDGMGNKTGDELFERLIAAVALYRPGPMDYIPEYLESMKDRSKIHYDHPLQEKSLAPTYGVMVYQEQLMQIAQQVAGYNMAEADILRKAAGRAE